MGSFLRPVGSEPPAVYWRRRILVFGIPLVLIGFTAYACSGSGGGGGGNGAKGTASATPTNSSAIITPGPGSTSSLPPINSYPVTGPTGSSTATSTAGSGGSGGSGGSSGGSGGSGSSGGVGVAVGSTGCVLSVTLQLDKSSTSGPPTYSTGQNPTFNVILKNSGTQNCMFDVSGKGIVVTVTPVGSSTAAWTSATCAGAQDVRVLGPGDGYTDAVKWARETSESNCPANPPLVAAGSYTVSAAASGVSAASVQFSLQ